MEDRIQGINEKIEALQSELKLEHDKIDKASSIAQENLDLRRLLGQHYRFCKEVVSGYEGLRFYKETKSMLNKEGNRDDNIQ